MCTLYKWHLRATLRQQVLKQLMGAASAPSHHYWCGAARVDETYKKYDYAVVPREVYRVHTRLRRGFVGFVPLPRRLGWGF